LADDAFADAEAGPRAAAAKLADEAKLVLVGKIERRCGSSQIARQKTNDTIRHFPGVHLAPELVRETGLTRLEPISAIAFHPQLLEALRHLVRLPDHRPELVMAQDPDG